MKTETEKAYLAGIIDGEGSIMLVLRAPNNNACDVRLVITNTSTAIVEWVKSHVSISPQIQMWNDKKNLHWKTRITLSWYCGNAVEILREVYKYLVIKQAQAEICLDYYDNLLMPQGSKIPVENVEKRLALHKKLKNINKRATPNEIARVEK